MFQVKPGMGELGGSGGEGEDSVWPERLVAEGEELLSHIKKYVEWKRWLDAHPWYREMSSAVENVQMSDYLVSEATRIDAWVWSFYGRSEGLPVWKRLKLRVVGRRKFLARVAAGAAPAWFPADVTAEAKW
jgi:hypothetical protein